MKKWKTVTVPREFLLAVFFLFGIGLLLYRLYNLQIINGSTYASDFSVMITKTRSIKSTRGNIYDRFGRVIAYNSLSYSLAIEDIGSYSSTREHTLALNGEAHEISGILKKHGDSLSNTFHIKLDENGNYVFDCRGTSLLRFKADVYGRAKISELLPEEENADADKIIDDLMAYKRFGLIGPEKKPYTAEELAKYGLPEELTKEEILEIIFVRYMLFTTQFRKYVRVTIATELSDESVANLEEYSDRLTGITVIEDCKRCYTYPEAFASIIGYTGKISTEELAELKEKNAQYNVDSIVGKSGIEKIYEEKLQGTNGEETVYVNRLGKVVGTDEDAYISPSAGANIYLTIDSDLQFAVYKILEQRIAGILESVIINEETFDKSTVQDSTQIRIPINDVYNAFFKNSVIDTGHFDDSTATATEIKVGKLFDQKQASVFVLIKDQLTAADPLPYNQLSEELKEYESYIINDLLTGSAGILDADLIDKTDETYLKWSRDRSISMKEYLTYAAGKNWINLKSITNEEEYLDSNETYNAVSGYIEDTLEHDERFSKILYKYMIQSHIITGNDIIDLLYEQGIISMTDGSFEQHRAGTISDYDLIISKIHSLEITPAMLALEPCSGSAVVTDPNTGEILACVTYPGYDNNRLANTMDVDYYNRLVNDLSMPFYNKATQTKTAPGSTFKPVTASAGLEEGVITPQTTFECNGLFDLTETPLKCWHLAGHGTLDVVGGIKNSCNVYFCNVAYLLGLNEEGNWSDSLSISKIANYAKLFDLDKNSGIEIPEASPQVSDQYAIQSSIGQGTHAYTTTQLARYVSTIANGGTSYQLSLIDRITDADNVEIQSYVPKVQSNLSLSDDTWDVIHRGMRAVVQSTPEFNELQIDVSGKTGTAQESKSHPSHALFVSYAPSDSPEVAMAVRIANGYSSKNAALTARDIYEYYFKLKDSSKIITGKARLDSISQDHND